MQQNVCHHILFIIHMAGHTTHISSMTNASSWWLTNEDAYGSRRPTRQAGRHMYMLHVLCVLGRISHTDPHRHWFKSSVCRRSRHPVTRHSHNIIYPRSSSSAVGWLSHRSHCNLLRCTRTVPIVCMHPGYPNLSLSSPTQLSLESTLTHPAAQHFLFWCSRIPGPRYAQHLEPFIPT